jgi:hypothetical protein
MVNTRSRVGCSIALLAATLSAQKESPLPIVQLAHGAGSQLSLRYGVFDPLREMPAVPGWMAAREDVRLFVVQFVGAPTEALRARVRSAGAELFGYLPHDAYVARMDAATAAKVRQVAGVRFVGHYEPAWRLEPELFAMLASGLELPTARYNLVVVDKRNDKLALARKITDLGGRVVDEQEGSILFVADLNGAQLASAARLDEVLWIDRWSAPEIDMNNARIQGGANYLETQIGYTGQGVRGHIYEGLEANHPDFTTPLTNVLSGGGPDAHGHCTAGIVFGNGTSIATARGMAPNAVGFFTQYSSTTQSRNATIGTLLNTHQVMFTTASWGDARTTQYTSVSADADDVIFDHRMPWTQSQSNAGNQQSRPQAWAKNIFSIGGVAHRDNANPADDSWAAGGGSTGPAADGRIKPDLSSYYDAIQCSDLSGSAGYSAGNFTNGFGGTSGATPIVAGHNALAIQMYFNGLFGPVRVPGGTPFQNRPLAQTLKALQIVSARQYAFNAGSADNRREHVGWGFPSLQDMYDNASFTFLVPEDDILTQGQSAVHVVNVAANEPELKICMTFVDPAGNPAATLARVNDLTLRVTAPNGTFYYGNNGLTTGNYSTTGGSPNTIDTVECVFVQNPAAGQWTIEVIATLVAQDAHVSTGVVDASYALVAVPATSAGGGGARARINPYGQGCAPASTPQVGRTFYEQFGSFDLANSARRFTPNGSGGWNVGTEPSGFDASYTNGLNLGDDQLVRARPLGFSFPLAGGGSTTSIDVDSNGWIGLVANQASGTDYTETIAEFLANPARIAAIWDDLNPSAAGDVYFDARPGVALITWAGVPEYSNTGSNTAQIRLYPDGSFVLAYQACSVADCIVGYSVGGVQDPGASDISNPGGATAVAHTVSAMPRLGTSVNLLATELPASTIATLSMLGLGQQSLDLSAFGSPGCTLLTQILSSSAMTLGSGSASRSLTIPNDPSLVGGIVTSQCIVADPSANQLGILTTNGIELILGN